MLAGVIRFGVLIGTTAGGVTFDFGADGVTFGFGGRSSMSLPTAGLTFGRTSDVGVDLGFEDGIEDFAGFVVAVVLGCATTAFLSSGPSRTAGIEVLLRMVAEDRGMVVVPGLAAAKMSCWSDRPEDKRVFEEAGGIDEM